ncbi:MAG TPA: SRPBCC domain-containing protein [Polyangia bacterium]|nr:SRPBCC domain-containing protein [Polyangia bacterium]
MTTPVPPVKKELIIRAAPAHAFRTFTEGMTRWWPPQHHIGKSPLARMVVEPRVGGRWYSVCEDGSECDIGRVLAWEPPARLVLSWQITSAWAFDPAFVTEVEVTFTPVEARRTRVTFEHRLLDRYLDAAEALRKQLDDPKGWHVTLERFGAAAAQKAVVIYESSPDVLAKAPVHYPAHKARVDVFHARGDLLATGLFGDPREGSMAVFASREAAEEFVRDDPFVVEGVVARATIKDWNETLLP